MLFGQPFGGLFGLQAVDNDPVFAGALAAVSIAPGTVLVTWAPATDDTVDQHKILYRVYAAVSPGGQDFGNPRTSVVGQAGATVTGLLGGTRYYFVVRAFDDTGHNDTNTVEVSAVADRQRDGSSLLVFDLEGPRVDKITKIQ